MGERGPLQLEPDTREGLLHQHGLDIEFLQEHDIVDYSVMLRTHDLWQAEDNECSMAPDIKGTFRAFLTAFQRMEVKRKTTLQDRMLATFTISMTFSVLPGPTL